MLELAQEPLLEKIKTVDAEYLVGDKIKSDHPLFGVVWINLDRLSGVPCFYGTRVPIKTLFDCLAAGETLDDFLDGFLGVEREQALAVLQLASRGLITELEAI